MVSIMRVSSQDGVRRAVARKTRIIEDAYCSRPSATSTWRSAGSASGPALRPSRPAGGGRSRCWRTARTRRPPRWPPAAAAAAAPRRGAPTPTRRCSGWRSRSGRSTGPAAPPSRGGGTASPGPPPAAAAAAAAAVAVGATREAAPIAGPVAPAAVDTAGAARSTGMRAAAAAAAVQRRFPARDGPAGAAQAQTPRRAAA